MFCYNCEKFFPDEDVCLKRDDETTLHIHCCPFCGDDDIGESETCVACGEEFAEGETASGYCVSCLVAEVDYDTTLAYLKDRGYLADFLIRDWFNAGTLTNSSYDLDKFLEETFRRLVANDKLSDWCSGYHSFLDACRTFCVPGRFDNNFGTEGREFAEWLEGYKAKKQKENEKND